MSQGQRRLTARGPMLVLVSALALSAICLKILPAPFVWLLWGWAAACFAGAWYLKVGFSRVVLFNAAVLLALVAIVETYLTCREQQRPLYSDGYYTDDDLLGNVPAKSTQGHSREVEKGRVVYDVTYTVDSNGLRIAPSSEGAAQSVLFFGCSFTYGEGLQDTETMPYQVGLQTRGHYQTYNFGFHGYAPNQMLAEIEGGRVHEIVRQPAAFAIYQALPDHIPRIAGKIPYGKHNPRYELKADGTVQRVGHFDDGIAPPTALALRIRGQLGKSAIYRTLTSIEPRMNENDVRLLLATVGKSRDLLAEQYPGIEFHVILWRNFPYEQHVYEELQAGFARMNIPVHRVEDILPGYNTSPEKYWLDPKDQHPNANADRIIATYIANNVLSRHAVSDANR